MRSLVSPYWDSHSVLIHESYSKGKLVLGFGARLRVLMKSCFGLDYSSYSF